MKNKSEKLYTVFDEDLIELLKSINQWDALQRGELFCVNCKTPITLKNLQIIIPNNKEDFDFICNVTGCIASYKEKEG